VPNTTAKSLAVDVHHLHDVHQNATALTVCIEHHARLCGCSAECLVDFEIRPYEAIDVFVHCTTWFIVRVVEQCVRVEQLVEIRGFESECALGAICIPGALSINALALQFANRGWQRPKTRQSHDCLV